MEFNYKYWNMFSDLLNYGHRDYNHKALQTNGQASYFLELIGDMRTFNVHIK
jgi:hypothetical protein